MAICVDAAITFRYVQARGQRERVKEQLVGFRFKKASCVVVGTFNMYIVQPAWLAKIGLIPEGVAVVIASKLDEPGFRYSSPKLTSRWFVTPSRIEVETESPDEDCGNLVATVLEKLPWTPLVGIGNNTVYSAGLDELDRLPALNCFNPAAPEGYELAQRSFHLGVGRGEEMFNLQLSIVKEEIEISANTHRELRDRESGSAQETARNFFGHRRESENLLRDLFQVDIDHGTTNGQPA
jgi:hypothetical protein